MVRRKGRVSQKDKKLQRGVTKGRTGWQWRKRYRVWDANRKVFVYPENWIEPKQRVPPKLDASLLGIAALICPDCYIKTSAKRRHLPKRSQLKGVRLVFVSKNLKEALAAAQLLAAELGRDLYRIDLRDIVSKQIGETEKHIGSVFSAARKGDAILFFDEADALFGRRVQVHDAHGRYADIEVNYLLHRIENHAGVSILRFASRKHMSRPSLRRFHFAIAIPLKKRDAGKKKSASRRH